MVARDGIESATRGFSGARRPRFGATKPKKLQGFPRGRPNRTRRPSPYRTLRRPADRTPAREPCGSTSSVHRDRAGTEPDTTPPLVAEPDSLGFRRQPNHFAEKSNVPNFGTAGSRAAVTYSSEYAALVTNPVHFSVVAHVVQLTLGQIVSSQPLTSGSAGTFLRWSRILVHSHRYVRQ